MADIFCIIEYDFILLPLQLFATISTIWFTHRYMKEFKTRKRMEFGSKSLYCHSLSFFILIAAFFACQSVDIAVRCFPELEVFYSNINLLNSMLYGTESTCLMVLLFFRLYQVFNDTAYALSRRDIMLYCVTYGVNLASGIASIFVYTDYHTVVATILFSLWFISMLLLVVILVSFFVYKMMAVYKSAKIAMKDDAPESNDPRLLRTITKITILTIFSLISTVLFAAMTMLRPSLPNPDSFHMHFVLTLIVTNDVYTNFLSMFLGFTPFQGLYIKLFGCCDALCQSKCHKMAGNETELQLRMQQEEQCVEATTTTTSNSNLEKAQSSVTNEDASI
eukprot:138402_1